MKPVPTILYAEDDRDDLEMLEEALKSIVQEFNLVHVKNGKEVIDLLTERPELTSTACVILLDINMPLVNGKEVLEWIKERSELEHVPVLMFTTSEYTLDIKYCEDLGARVINKPQLFEELIDIAKEILEICNNHYQV